MRHVLMLVLASGVALAAQARPPFSAARFLTHVKVLAADGLEGRGNGQAGLELAADYIRDRFRDTGLRGAFDGRFEQHFEAEIGLDPPADAALEIETAAGPARLALGRGFHPLSILERAPGTAPPVFAGVPVVFAGYGISAPGLGYDDFAAVDVRGAAVLVFTHEPQEHDRHSIFAGRELTPGAAVSQKAKEARERGALLLLVVEDPSHVDDRAARGAWWNDPQSENMVIPVLRVARERLVAALPALDLAQAAADIDRTLQPRSIRLAGVGLSYVEHRAGFIARLTNIVGVLPGSDPVLAAEAVVVGAHYDHIGRGGRWSDRPQASGEVHNGADDNASGVAALVEIARAASREPTGLRRTVIFAAFAGEEMGLLGSERYVADPPVALARTRAMVNLDMVGRARGRVMVGLFGPPTTVASASQLRPWTRLVVQDFSRGGYAAEDSDVGPFARRGVPAIAFFTGFHADYHRPSDDWTAIDAEGGAAVAELAFRLVRDLAR